MERVILFPAGGSTPVLPLGVGVKITKTDMHSWAEPKCNLLAHLSSKASDSPTPFLWGTVSGNFFCMFLHNYIFLGIVLRLSVMMRGFGQNIYMYIYIFNSIAWALHHSLWDVS